MFLKVNNNFPYNEQTYYLVSVDGFEVPVYPHIFYPYQKDRE